VNEQASAIGDDSRYSESEIVDEVSPQTWESWLRVSVVREGETGHIVSAFATLPRVTYPARMFTPKQCNIEQYVSQ